jgi:hypothetical protein
MAKRLKAHYSLNAGETNPQYERRQDWEFWINSAKRLQNVRLLQGSGFKRRPGLARVATLSGVGKLVPFRSVAGADLLVILKVGAIDVMTTAESISTTALSGSPWTAPYVTVLQASSENNQVTVTGPESEPWVLTYTAPSTWTDDPISDLYLTRADGSVAQPYYKFPDTKGIVVTVAAVSGTGVAITATASLFVAGHVGTRFRLYDREVEIATVTNGTTGTCDVIQTLYPTLDITVASSVGFAVGDEVATDLDDLNGEVVAVPSSTVVRVNRTDGYTYPVIPASPAENNLVGPTAKSVISAVAAAAATVGTTQWDEQMISSVRGNPTGNVYHRGRRCLLGFAQAPHVFVASAQDQTDDFDVGDGTDEDAIQVKIGDAFGSKIRHGVSTEQLIVLTDSGPYYVGEGPGTPFTPTTVDFLDVGPEPAADANPLKSSEGVIYVDREVSRLMILAPTGNVRRSWETGDLSDLAPHLLQGITRLCLIDGSEWGPERYVAAINSSGNLSVMHYRRGEQVLGWVEWTTDGTFIDICRFNNKVYVIVLRGSTYYLERFDEDRLLDDSLLATGTSTITNAHWANATREVIWRKTVSGQARRASLGNFTANGSGVISGLAAESRDYEVGQSFPLKAQMHPPLDPDKPFNSPIRISRAILDLVDSGHFAVNEEAVSAYDYYDDQEEPPPLRSRQEHVALLGCEWDNTVTIEQPVAAPLTIRMIVVEAS